MRERAKKKTGKVILRGKNDDLPDGGLAGTLGRRGKFGPWKWGGLYSTQKRRGLERGLGLSGWAVMGPAKACYLSREKGGVHMVSVKARV